MTSCPRKDVSSLSEPTPSFFSALEKLWFNKYFDECAKLSVSEPYLDGEALEAEAEEITISYFYYRARDRLNFYLNDHTWRAGME